MKRIATMMALALLVGAMNIAWAQPNRVGKDVIWARDVDGATMTLDGMLNEDVWQQAESIPFEWNNILARPGSGQKIEGNPELAEPLDGNDGTLRVLRDGNILWMSMEVNDKSVGGGRGLVAGNWFFDGILMSMIDRSRRPDDFSEFESFNGQFGPWQNMEIIYGWFHPADTLDGGAPIPDIEPRAFGEGTWAQGFGDALADPPNPDLFNYVTTVDGTANDDTHGEDVGYVMEWMINLDSLQYDMTSAEGDVIPFTMALQDADYLWPVDMAMQFVSRVWWQNQWINNIEDGVAYIYGRSDVTVNSGAVPAVNEPEFTIRNVGESEVVLDGQLDEDVWTIVDPLFQLQYQADPEDLDAWLPGSLAPYYTNFFRPDLNGEEPNPTVVDPTIGKFRMLNDGSTLYIGLDTDDQAISGLSADNGLDGFRVTIRSLDSLRTNGQLAGIQFLFSIDSTGTIRYGEYAAALQNENPDAVTAAVSLKGSGTAADPSDIDEGYQIEVAIDLQALGYDSDLGDRQIWLGLTYFDGDFLENMNESYATRTWMLSERAVNAALYGYLSTEFSGVANEDPTEVPDGFALKGNYPNPFNPSTTLNYTLSRAGNVTLFVYDVLGRRVAEQTIGAQAAGEQRVAFDGKNLSSGVYFYRLQVQGADKSAFLSPVGRMVLLK